MCVGSLAENANTARRENTMAALLAGFRRWIARREIEETEYLGGIVFAAFILELLELGVNESIIEEAKANLGKHADELVKTFNHD